MSYHVSVNIDIAKNLFMQSLSKLKPTVVNKKLKELSSNISEIDSENANLIEALNQANTAVTQSEMEIEKRNNIIKGLKEENQQLLIQLQEKQNDFDYYQSSAQQETDMLRQRLEEEEEEKDNLLEQLEKQNNEINQFRVELIKYENNGNLFINEKIEKENKLNNIIKEFQIKEEEYISEIDNLRMVNAQLNKELENLKNKYDKKTKVLKLQYDGASIRVNKLIHTCITLKQQVLNLKRKVNIENANNSMNLGNHQNKFSSLVDDDLFNQTF